MALTLHGTVSDNTVVLDRRSAKPIIINGDMHVSQKATSTTGITGNGVHTIDRIALDLSDNGTWTQTQSTDVPTGQGFASSLKMDCTTADAAVAAGTYHLLRYKFEGQDCQLFKKGTSSAEYITVAFWIKSNKTGTFTVELFDSEGDDRTISKTFTIDSGDTWEKKVLSFIGDTSVAQPNTNALGLSVNIWMTGGSTFTGGTLQTAWGAKTDNERADTSVNIADSTDNEYYLTGLQVEVGNFDANSIAPFQHESFGDSLARCQRYLPAYIGTLNNFRLPAAGITGSTTQVFLTLNHPVTTRVKPSGVVVSDAGHWSGGVDGILANQAMGSVAYGLSSTFATRLTWAVASGTPFTARDPAYIEGTNTSAVLYLTGCEL
jgi:hypothetical protein